MLRLKTIYFNLFVHRTCVYFAEREQLTDVVGNELYNLRRQLFDVYSILFGDISDSSIFDGSNVDDLPAGISCLKNVTRMSKNIAFYGLTTVGERADSTTIDGDDDEMRLNERLQKSGKCVHMLLAQHFPEVYQLIAILKQIQNV